MNFKMTDSVKDLASPAHNEAVREECVTGNVRMSERARSKKAMRLLTEQLFAGLAWYG